MPWPVKSPDLKCMNLDGHTIAKKEDYKFSNAKRRIASTLARSTKQLNRQFYQFYEETPPGMHQEQRWTHEILFFFSLI
jgi:hypothetical protein